MVFSWCNLSFPILWNIRNFLCNFLVSLFSIRSCWELFQHQKLLLQTSITGRGESTLLELKDWTAWINLSFITKPHTSSGPSHLPTGHFEMWGTSEIVSHGGRREIFLKIKFSKIYLNLWLVCSLFLLPQPCHEMISSSFLLGWTVKWSCRSFALWMLCCESSQLLETAYVLRIMCVWSLSFSSPYLFILEFSRASHQHLPPGICSALIILPLVQAEICSHSCPREQGLTGEGPFW